MPVFGRHATGESARIDCQRISEALSAHLPLLENQVSNIWSMGVATVDRIANKGNSLMERELTVERIRARLEVAPGNSAARAAANPR